ATSTGKGLLLGSRADDLAREAPIDAVPVAQIAAIADLIAPVPLPAVIKRHNIRIRNERRLMLVLDLYRGSRKNEAVVIGRAGVLKCRIVPVAAKSADAHQAAFKNDGIRERRLSHFSAMLCSRRFEAVASSNEAMAIPRSASARRSWLRAAIIVL